MGRPFDPARVKDTIKEIASKLNKEGETCVRRVAFATAKLKTKIQRWSKNKPMQEEEPLEETDTLELAEVQADLDEAVDGSKQLENTFEDDVEGKNYRDKYVKEALTGKISDSNKPSICGDEFDTLKTAFNIIVDDYTNLPTKLKAQGVHRVAFEFSETDLGRTDLEDSQ